MMANAEPREPRAESWWVVQEVGAENFYLNTNRNWGPLGASVSFATEAEAAAAAVPQGSAGSTVRHWRLDPT